jgi:hypothetical protein
LLSDIRSGQPGTMTGPRTGCSIFCIISLATRTAT